MKIIHLYIILVLIFSSCSSTLLLNIKETKNIEILTGRSGELFIKSTRENGRYKEEIINSTIIKITEDSIYTVNNSDISINYHFHSIKKFVYVDTEQGLRDGLNVALPIIGIPYLTEYLISGDVDGWGIIFYGPLGLVTFAIIAASSHTYTIYFQ